MAWKITKNNGGNYDVWSTVIDDFVFKDIVGDVLVEFYVGRTAGEAREYIRKWLKEVDADFNKNTK